MPYGPVQSSAISKWGRLCLDSVEGGLEAFDLRLLFMRVGSKGRPFVKYFSIVGFFGGATESTDIFGEDGGAIS